VLAIEIQFCEPQRTKVCDPDAVFIHDDVKRELKTIPFADELDLLGIWHRPKHIDAAVATIEDKNPGPGSDRQGVDTVELPGTRSFPSELRNIVRVPIQNDYSIVVEAIRDKNSTVRKKGNVLGPA
jgi:hypothetical protein